jgi:hypothetical protein
MPVSPLMAKIFGARSRAQTSARQGKLAGTREEYRDRSSHAAHRPLLIFPKALSGSAANGTESSQTLCAVTVSGSFNDYKDGK